MYRALDHLYIFGTIVFTVYSQLVMRWQVSLAGDLPTDLIGKAKFVGVLFLNPWVMSSIVATLLSGISWMLAMAKFEISYAYPWVGLNFVLMPLLGVLLFSETLSFAKTMGTIFVVVGIFVIAKS